MSGSKILVLTAALAAAGCAPASASRARVEAARAEAANKEVARRIFTEILSKGRFDLVAELYAPDFRNGSASLEEDMAAARDWREAFPDLVLDVDLLVAEGEYVTVLWTGRGTNTGTGNGLPATGRKLLLRGITIWKVVGGKVKEEWSAFDEMTIAKQLGLLPASK